MSNGEVKRWILENHGGELFSSPIIDTYEEVVSSTDHERIVAELFDELTNRSESLRQTTQDWLEARAELEQARRVRDELISDLQTIREHCLDFDWRRIEILISQRLGEDTEITAIERGEA